jgi:NADH-quinone oxidoreductase subunit A
MTELVGYMALFVVVAVFFVFIHLVAGRFIRPVKPDPEKLTIYECGEPTIGSSWIQFDLRFYVVALLFVIFDVEVAFFFPWAVVFGKVNTLARMDENDSGRGAIVKELVPANPNRPQTLDPQLSVRDAKKMGWLAFWDLTVFFGVLLVGFAYLWKRGDLDWVRSMAAERAAAGASVESAPLAPQPALVGTAKEVQHV